MCLRVRILAMGEKGGAHLVKPLFWGVVILVLVWLCAVVVVEITTPDLQAFEEKLAQYRGPIDEEPTQQTINCDMNPFCGIPASQQDHLVKRLNRYIHLQRTEQWEGVSNLLGVYYLGDSGKTAFTPPQKLETLTAVRSRPIVRFIPERAITSSSLFLNPPPADEWWWWIIGTADRVECGRVVRVQEEMVVAYRHNGEWFFLPSNDHGVFIPTPG